MPFVPTRLLIEERALDLPLTRRVIANLPEARPEILPASGRVSAGPGILPGAAYAAAKRTLMVGLHPGGAFRSCRPSADYELNLGASCPGLCQYCYLQGSQGLRPYIRVYADLEAILDQATGLIAAAPPGKPVSFEASSTSDPLAIEPLTGAVAETISFFGRRPGAQLRLVTKFTGIDGLLGLDHRGRTRLRFSLNTPYVVRTFEAGTDPLPARIEAANRLGRAGYPLGFVLAPLIIYAGWREDYDQLLHDLAGALDPALAKDLHFELISHRFTAKTKEVIRSRFPACRLELDESHRAIKWGRYGHRKFVYPAEDLRALWSELKTSITHRFPTAVIEYAT